MIDTPSALTVSEYLDATNEILSAVPATVQGEITSLKVYPKAVYFNLTDATDKAVLNCMAWRSQVESFGIQLKEGLTVQIYGRAEIYKPSGRFSFLARAISPVGEGALKAAFEALKKKLAAAGYFDDAHKRPLPLYPETIGLITSARGAAIDDFRMHLTPIGLHVTLCDVLVQGTQAVDSIVQAIQWFNQQPNPVAVLVVTRGGGSLEDLQPFNAERVAQAIFASKIPIISAVGHEQDISISDLVADFRASTPTAAAKTLSAPWVEASHHVARFESAIINRFQLLVQTYQSQTTQLVNRMLYDFESELTTQKHLLTTLSQDLTQAIDSITKSFNQLAFQFDQHCQRTHQAIQQIHQQLAVQTTQILQSFHHHWRHTNSTLTQLTELLNAHDPERKLKQGYSLLFSQTGQLIRSVSQLKTGDTLTGRLSDGKVTATVLQLEPTASTN